jgi:hypothetical protein
MSVPVHLLFRAMRDEKLYLYVRIPSAEIGLLLLNGIFILSADKIFSGSEFSAHGPITGSFEESTLSTEAPSIPSFGTCGPMEPYEAVPLSICALGMNAGRIFSELSCKRLWSFGTMNNPYILKFTRIQQHAAHLFTRDDLQYIDIECQIKAMTTARAALNNKQAPQWAGDINSVISKSAVSPRLRSKS